MECTQRLECTQDLNPEPYSQRSGPEQIGFLGICGQTYPVNIGPNKIGRDPQTCSIVLDMKSLSRQHAVINVLGSTKKEYMLMDLGSVNKTKLGVKTLQAYVPYPLQNGDTVQFGDVFGIFRLFEDDTDLPMTQAIAVPDTPVHHRHISKIGQSGITTVPESPDVSDKDDSFIGSSQQTRDPEFKSPKLNFLKNSGKTVMRPAIGTNKINNIFWSSSQKSPSLKLNLDDSGTSLSDSSSTSVNTVNSVINVNKPDDVHSMVTQMPFANENDEGSDSIYTANTQLPSQCDFPSAHSLETQLPSCDSPAAIHSLDTQMPLSDKLPSVHKINEQQEMQMELSIASKNNVSIHNAVTQRFVSDDIHNAETQNEISIHDVNTQFIPNSIHEAKTQAFDNLKIDRELVNDSDSDEPFTKKDKDSDKISHKTISESDEEIIMNEFDDAKEDSLIKSFSKIQDSEPAKFDKNTESDEEILFDEVDGHEFDDNLNSQPLIPPDLSPTKSSDKENMPIDGDTCSPIIGRRKCKRSLDSDDSTDCEDFSILPTQKIAQGPMKIVEDDDTDCEDNLICNKLKTNKGKISNANENVTFEEMATQIIEKNSIDEHNVTCFEDMPTQIIEEDEIAVNNSNEDCFEDMATQIIPAEKEQQYSDEIISPFKIPLISPIKVRRKDIVKLTSHCMSSNSTPIKLAVPEYKDENEDKFYPATQDLFDDLCSQRVPLTKPQSSKDNDEVVPCSVEEFEVGDRFRHIDNEVSPTKTLVVADKSSESSDHEENVLKYVSGLSSKQIKDVVGVKDVSISVPTKKSSSDLSDIEITPKKKIRPFKFMNVELPNSQEIKISVSQTSNNFNNETSSESEQDVNSQEGTPILFKKKVRSKKSDAKIDLTAKFDADALPSRIITRVRKPPSRLQDSGEGTSKIKENILKPKYLTEQEDNIDRDIITENITRLTKRNDKNKSTDKTKSKDALKDTSNKRDTRENKKKETTEASKSSSKRKKESNTKTKSKGKAHNDNSKAKKNTQADEKSTSKNSIKSLKIKEIEDIVNIDSEIEEKQSLETTTAKKRGRPKKDTNQKPNTADKTRKEPEKRKRTHKSPSPREEDSTENIRRSKRQRTSKDKDNTQDDSQTERTKTTTKLNKDSKATNPQLKSILKLRDASQDRSAVYASSESSLAESPVAPKKVPQPGAKRTRSCLSSSVSLRSTPSRAVKTQYVLFTAFPNEEVKNKLKKLGAEIVSDVTTCTVLVTLQIKRTFKLLCVVGLGKPIVGPNWVQACSDTNTIVDPWQYLVQDEAAEKRFHFNLQRTLAGKRNFLKGYNVSATPSVMPSGQEMKLIVECSGGVWREGGAQWICVSTSSDKTLWSALKRRGAILVSTELILGGVLRQKLDIEANKLKCT